MKLAIASYLLVVSIASCSICRFKEVYKESVDGKYSIHYSRINPKCPRGSDVEGYNKEGYLFWIYTVDSLHNYSYYYFYLDSERVNKYYVYKGGRISYDLAFDSSYTVSLTDLEKHIFKKIAEISDSLNIKDLTYLSNSQGFKFKSEWKPSKKK